MEGFKSRNKMIYKFLLKDNFDNIYGFETVNEILYEIEFKASPYIFGEENKNYSYEIFEFIISVFIIQLLKIHR